MTIKVVHDFLLHSGENLKNKTMIVKEDEIPRPPLQIESNRHVSARLNSPDSFSQLLGLLLVSQPLPEIRVFLVMGNKRSRRIKVT